MKIALTVKNSSKVLKPTENDVIIYDGEDWYVTTKDKLLEESNHLLQNCKNELEKLKKENADFKREVASQLLQMSKLIEKLYGGQGE